MSRNRLRFFDADKLEKFLREREQERTRQQSQGLPDPQPSQTVNDAVTPPATESISEQEFLEWFHSLDAHDLL